MHFKFQQVDVFGNAHCDHALLGNPVAVVHDADGLSDEMMQRFARWTNLSETTFLLSPTDPRADYRLRIFTPGGELPFAGHPTLGSCHAWREGGGVARSSAGTVQECGVGLVEVRERGAQLFFAAPALRRTGPMSEADVSRLVSALAVPSESVRAHQWVDNGPGWCALLLDSAERVLSITPDFAALSGFNVGLVGAHAADVADDFEVRAFVPDLGVPEDPVTGSLNAGIGQWLIAEGLAAERYTARQGTAMHRAGRVFVEKEEDQIWVGGAAQVCIAGELRLPD